MAKQRFLNNFNTTFIAAVNDAPSTGTPATELGYGVLRLSDGAAGALTNPTGGDYYVLTAFKRTGSTESNIEIMRVTAVDNSTPGECRVSVLRAQEGTTAKTFVPGDYLSLRMTRGTAEGFAQPDDMATKEPVITAGTSAQYWRGDKSWQDFAADVRATTLTGLSTATSAVIAAADTVLGALGKLQAQITGHTGASSGAHAATAISNTPAGNIAATTVQAAIDELDSEKQATLVSGTNIKTAGGQSLVGSGNAPIVAPETHAATDKPTPVDADELGISDSAASWGLKKLTFANLKAWLSGLFVGKTGAQTMTGDLTVPSLNGGQLAGLRNKIINGGFDVWQRGATRSVGTGVSTAYVADRWMGVRSGFVPGATVSQQPAGLTGFRYCARVQRDSGNADTAGINLEQDLETSACIPFQGAAVTLSFYARCGANYSAASSALAVRLVSGTGTDQNALVGTFTGATNAVDSTATLTTTWQRFSYTVTIGAGVTQLGSRFIHTPTGTAGAADYFEITGVQLEISSVATPFEHRPYGMELALCQRYYYRLTSTSVDAVLGNAAAQSTTLAVATGMFPVPMRTEPTALEQSGVTSDYVIAIGAGANLTGVPTLASAMGENTWAVDFPSTGLTTGQGGYVRKAATANGFLGFSAEL